MNFFCFYAGQCISPAKFHIPVRIWQLPLTPQSRWGPLSPPRRGRFPRQSPCQPGRLKTKVRVRERLRKQASVSNYSSPLPFFKAFSMSFSSSRACLFPGSFLKRVRMYFKAFSYSWELNAGEKRQSCQRWKEESERLTQSQPDGDSVKRDFPVISFYTESSRRSFWPAVHKHLISYLQRWAGVEYTTVPDTPDK